MKRARHFLGALLLAAACAGAAEQQAMPARNEPKHKVVFENNYVRVIDVQIPVGTETLYHRHDIASVMVYLTKATNESQTYGEANWTARTLTPGDSRYAAYDVKPLTHHVRNRGATLFHVYDIELLHAPLTAEDFALPDTPVLHAQWQEKAVRSLTLKLAPGAHHTVPDGACGYFLVGIAGTLTVSTTSGAVRELRPSEFFFQPAKSGFVLSNGGKEPLEAVVLELR
jgi:hypothetical protein